MTLSLVVLEVLLRSWYYVTWIGLIAIVPDFAGRQLNSPAFGGMLYGAMIFLAIECYPSFLVLLHMLTGFKGL
jgi:hypothetical protein